MSSKRPLQKALYLQVRDALAERIASGAWKPGTPIANESDLARDIGVSAGTVRKALELLEAQRLITRRQGRGTFVSDQNSEELASRLCKLRGPDGARLDSRAEPVEFGRGTANERERARLRLSAGEAVYRMRRIRRHEGRTFMVKDAVVPVALFPDLPCRKDVARGINAIARAFGVLVGSTEERISLRVPPAGVAEALGVAQGTPVLHLDRVVHALDGPPLEWCTGHCHLPGCYYLADLGVTPAAGRR